MRLSIPEIERHLEDNPFYLKRKGDYQAALRSYANHFSHAQMSGDVFIREQTFDQLFDISLLQYLKEQRRFSGVAGLRQHLESDIGELLREGESYDDREFKQSFASCWKRFNPRGRGKNPFSVDRDLLLLDGRHRGSPEGGS